MRFASASEALGALINAYYNERNIDAALSCVTEDIVWVGTEAKEYVFGKEKLLELLKDDINAYPDSFAIDIEPPDEKRLSDTVTLFTVKGKQVAEPGTVNGFPIRGTAICTKTAQGWLVSNVHLSVPNNAPEKYNLQKELDQDRKKEELLMSSIPGGVAIYRLKKNGEVHADYISEGLAKMFGFDDIEDYYVNVQGDVMHLTVQEDIPLVLKAAKESIAQHTSISITYRIHVKNAPDILQRLDANLMESDLREDDLGVWYAVHTRVSEQSKKIIQEQQTLKSLVNGVPAGLGIYELKNGKVYLTFLNDAFYNMMGVTRESRKKFMGDTAIQAVNPDDWGKVTALMQEVLHGKNSGSVLVRICDESKNWFWFNLAIAVIERAKDVIRIYIAYSDCDALVRSQQELLKNRVMTNVALESSKIMVWRYDYKHHRITDSASVGEIFHLPKVVENVPQIFLASKYVNQENAPLIRDLYAKVETEKTVSAEMSFWNLNGKGERWFKIIFTPVFDELGNYVEAVGSAIDITEQKQQERRYEEKLQLKKAAAQHALGYASYNLTKNILTEVDTNNVKIHQLLNCRTADEALQKLAEATINQEEKASFTTVADCATLLHAFKNGTNHLEIRHHIQGDVRWLQSSFDMLANPYTGDIELSVVLYDVTETVRAALVIDQLLKIDYRAIFTIDTKTGEVTQFRTENESSIIKGLVEKQRTMGDNEAALTEFFRELVIPEDFDRVRQECSKANIAGKLEQAPVYEVFYSIRVKGGIRHSRAVYTYLENNKTSILCAIQDVTEAYEREAQQQEKLKSALVDAEMANKAKTDFLSTMSHDMRTPMNGILGLTYLMDEQNDIDVVKKYTMQLRESAQYLLQLINAVLDVNKIESGKLTLHPEPYDEEKLFDAVIAMVKPLLDDKKIDFHFTKKHIDWQYMILDEQRVKQIFINLLSNAIKFTPKGGRIDFTMELVSMTKDMIVDKFVIKDTGIGITPEFLPHIFEAFSQERRGTDVAKAGTGLGLSIVKQLVELMGGSITVTSEINKGTTFTVYLQLPLAEKPLEEVKKEEAREEAQQAALDQNTILAGKKILLCEDHPLNVQIATKLLEKKHMIVFHAADGQLGLDAFKASKPHTFDLILMDVRMPILDGLQATRAIRALPREDAKTIPIIAMTANAFDEDRRNTKAAGMNAHLVKPIEPLVMFATLAKFLKK